MEGREIDEDSGSAKDGKFDENKFLVVVVVEGKKILVVVKKVEDVDKKMKVMKVVKELDIKIEMKVEEDAAVSDDEVIVVGDTCMCLIVKCDIDNMYVYVYECKLNLLNCI